MPQAQNITVKDGASTPADTQFTLMTPAAGNSPAVWNAKSKGPVTAAQPKLEISSQGFKNGRTAGRKVTLTLRVPAWSIAADQSLNISDAYFARVDVTVPDRVAASFRADGAAFIGNLIANAIIAEVFRDGYAPA